MESKLEKFDNLYKLEYEKTKLEEEKNQTNMASKKAQEERNELLGAVQEI